MVPFSPARNPSLLPRALRMKTQRLPPSRQPQLASRPSPPTFSGLHSLQLVSIPQRASIPLVTGLWQQLGHPSPVTPVLVWLTLPTPQFCCSSEKSS